MDRPTILVIDYEPRNLAATVEPLTAAGYHVEVARDGIAGLDAYRRLQPPVVFMEAMLPKKHAFEVCQEIRRSQTGRKTKVFILGAPSIAQSQQMKAVHQYGADRFLPRPVDGTTLLSLCSPILPGPSAPQVPEIDLLDPVALQAPREQIELSAMSEDDIMAQLDQLLPSVTAVPVAAAPAPAPAPRPAPSVAARPPAAPRAARPAAPAPRTIPVAPRPKPPAPPRAAAPQPVPMPPPPELRTAHVPDAAPSPPPSRSRLPMVLAGSVLATAAFGSWLLLRPGAAPAPPPVHAVPFSDEAPLEIAPAPDPTPTEVPAPAPVPTETHPPVAAVTSPPHVKLALTPPAERTKTETTVAQKPAPLAWRTKTETSSAVTPPPAPSTAPSTAPPTASAANETSAIPLPLAPPRLEPLPVGSDAARPRISPDVFLRRTEAGSLVDLHEVDKPPVPISRPAPAYPPAARQMRREGEIELRLLVDAQGQVTAVERLSSGKSDLAAAAERAARQWKYRPAMKDGVPVQVKIVEKVTFKL